MRHTNAVLNVGIIVALFLLFAVVMSLIGTVEADLKRKQSIDYKDKYIEELEETVDQQEKTIEKLKNKINNQN